MDKMNISEEKSFTKHALLLLCCLGCFNCREELKVADSKYNYIEPQYDALQLCPVAEEVSFPLDEKTYNTIKSFNIFLGNGIEYISFYDQRSQSINIYNFYLQKFIKKIWLENLFPDQKLKNTSVYVKNFDSLLVNNNSTFYILDSSGAIKKAIDFQKKPFAVRASFDNDEPPVLNGNSLFAKARPYLRETSRRELKKWKVLYNFDLEKDESKLYYHLPKTYLENIYGYRFFGYSYCFSSRSNFVFSFPADTCIYETNLSQYHIAYYGKSKFQTGNIQPVSKRELKTGETMQKSYLTRDTYGSIYFDPYVKRYLRVVKLKISEADYRAKKRRKKQRVIIFDEHFKIIGESPMDSDVLLSTISFTSNGCMYARTKARDEYALHLVRLVYSDQLNNQVQL